MTDVVFIKTPKLTFSQLNDGDHFIRGGTMWVKFSETQSVESDDRYNSVCVSGSLTGTIDFWFEDAEVTYVKKITVVED